MKILFYLPSNGGGGGAHSIVQECTAMRSYGVFPTIAVTDANVLQFRRNYPELNRNGIQLVTASDAESLKAHLLGIDVVCATTYQSVQTVRDALALMTDAKPKAAYYVQDFEPLFCVPGSANWKRAMSSYTDLPDAILFAKTDWLCSVVYNNTGARVRRVRASIDHSIYHPEYQLSGATLSVCAMIRPKTKRRAPVRTARILHKIAAAYKDAVRLSVFGCAPGDLSDNGIVLDEAIDNRGVLSREEVAAVLRSADLFLDLSDFQAFGRTGLEAMASGCIPMLPIFGGTDEYARHWKNAILVDPRSDELILAEIDRFFQMPAKDRSQMRLAAIDTSLEYTREKAAFSEVKLLMEAIAA